MDPQDSRSPSESNPSATPFVMSFTPPVVAPSGAGSTPAPMPAHILSAVHTPNGIGQEVTVQVPAVGGEHQFTYTIPGGGPACFTFRHDGHFRLIPSYAEGAAGNPSNGEGSARDHGDPNQGTPLPKLEVPHDIAHTRTVIWTIRYRGGGDANKPYSLHIKLGSC